MKTKAMKRGAVPVIRLRSVCMWVVWDGEGFGLLLGRHGDVMDYDETMAVGLATSTLWMN